MASSRKVSTKPRNHVVEKQRDVDEAQNVIVFPNTVSGNIYVDSDDRISLGSAVDAIYNNKNNIITSQTTQVGLKFVDMSYRMPNSNGRNNTYLFLIDGSPLEIPFELPVNNYTSATVLCDLIAAKMSTEATIITGLPFTITITQEGTTDVFKMSATTGFKFLLCNGVSFGVNLHGIRYTEGLTTELKILPKLYYTRYIDLLITEIIDAKTISHRFTTSKRFNTFNHLTRIFIPFTTENNNIQKSNFSREVLNINHYPFRHRDVVEFKITLLDEFQEKLYVETQDIITTQPIDSIKAEIPYLSYNLVLSIIG